MFGEIIKCGNSKTSNHKFCRTFDCVPLQPKAAKSSLNKEIHQKKSWNSWHESGIRPKHLAAEKKIDYDSYHSWNSKAICSFVEVIMLLVTWEHSNSLKTFPPKRVDNYHKYSLFAFTCFATQSTFSFLSRIISLRSKFFPRPKNNSSLSYLARILNFSNFRFRNRSRPSCFFKQQNWFGWATTFAVEINSQLIGFSHLLFFFCLIHQRFERFKRLELKFSTDLWIFQRWIV